MTNFLQTQEKTIEVAWLGRIAYDEAWALQKELVAARHEAPETPDKLLLLEHPPTFTLGRNGRAANLLLDEARLAQQGFAFHHVDRGGDITYHGPGQLVGYPILNLRRLYSQNGMGVARPYVYDLEEMLIQLLAQFGLTGTRYQNHRGVWIQGESGWSKIAAIGVRISRGVSSHGFALNVSTNLQHFKGIVPCGLAEYGVTSMSEHLGHPVDMDQVRSGLTAVFAKIFDYPPGFKPSVKGKLK